MFEALSLSIYLSIYLSYLSIYLFFFQATDSEPESKCEATQEQEGWCGLLRTLLYAVATIFILYCGVRLQQ